MRIATRSELRKHLKDLFKFIEIKDYTNAYDTSRRLYYRLRVFYITRGRDASHFADLFSDLEYLIVYADDCDMKTGLLLKSLGNIVNALREPTQNSSEKLKDLYDEILGLYIDINRENASSLLDCFDEIRSMRHDMKSQGGHSWIYFCQAMLELARVESAMMRIIKMEKIPNTLLAETESKFSDLFIAINGVLSLKSIEKKELKEAFDDGIPIEELSHGTGTSSDDLIKMIQDMDLEEDESD